MVDTNGVPSHKAPFAKVKKNSDYFSYEEIDKRREKLAHVGVMIVTPSDKSKLKNYDFQRTYKWVRENCVDITLITDDVGSVVATSDERDT